jgi:hypothetical protein
MLKGDEISIIWNLLSGLINLVHIVWSTHLKIHATVVSSDPQTPNIKISKHHIHFLLYLGTLQSVSANPRPWITFRNTYSRWRTLRSLSTPNWRGGGGSSRRLFATSNSTNLMFSISNGLGEGCTIPRARSPGRRNYVRRSKIIVGLHYGTTIQALRTLWQVLDFWEICALLVQALYDIFLVASNTSSIVGLFIEIHSSVSTVL